MAKKQVSQIVTFSLDEVVAALLPSLGIDAIDISKVELDPVSKEVRLIISAYDVKFDVAVPKEAPKP